MPCYRTFIRLALLAVVRIAHNRYVIAYVIVEQITFAAHVFERGAGKETEIVSYEFRGDVYDVGLPFLSFDVDFDVDADLNIRTDYAG